ncbi:hypothetical protein BDZ45DRAFT_637003, partial [Acephala macrosclerotiorum]
MRLLLLTAFRAKDVSKSFSWILMMACSIEAFGLIGFAFSVWVALGWQVLRSIIYLG